MSIRANTALLSCLLLVAPSLFADDDKGKKGRHDDNDDKKFERKVKVEHDNERDDVKVVRRVQVVQPVVVPANRIVITNNDVNRLESILATTQGSTVVFAQPTLIRVGNEANLLANRIVSNVIVIRNPVAVSTARTLRMHIRQLRAAARRGDAVAFRLHAREALPLVVRIDGMV
ncbi:MAG TPA: hypothetical protein VER58_16055 [Thermoanaerobaculia bacterium]|nr:hypothetical protein [Thermoanaerobaculia bacterium]